MKLPVTGGSGLYQFRHRSHGARSAVGRTRYRPATIDWYRANQRWMEHVKSRDYRHFYELNYAHRAR